MSGISSKNDGLERSFLVYLGDFVLNMLINMNNVRVRNRDMFSLSC